MEATTLITDDMVQGVAKCINDACTQRIGDVVVRVHADKNGHTLRFRLPVAVEEQVARVIGLQHLVSPQTWMGVSLHVRHTITRGAGGSHTVSALSAVSVGAGGAHGVVTVPQRPDGVKVTFTVANAFPRQLDLGFSVGSGAATKDIGTFRLPGHNSISVSRLGKRDASIVILPERGVAASVLGLDSVSNRHRFTITFLAEPLSAKTVEEQLLTRTARVMLTQHRRVASLQDRVASLKVHNTVWRLHARAVQLGATELYHSMELHDQQLSAAAQGAPLQHQDDVHRLARELEEASSAIQRKARQLKRTIGELTSNMHDGGKSADEGAEDPVVLLLRGQFRQTRHMQTKSRKTMGCVPLPAPGVYRSAAGPRPRQRGMAAFGGATGKTLVEVPQLRTARFVGSAFIEFDIGGHADVGAGGGAAPAAVTVTAADDGPRGREVRVSTITSM